jgi:hypothetical protein
MVDQLDDTPQPKPWSRLRFQRLLTTIVAAALKDGTPAVEIEDAMVDWLRGSTGFEPDGSPTKE